MRTPVEIKLILSVLFINASGVYLSGAYDVNELDTNGTGTTGTENMKNYTTTSNPNDHVEDAIEVLETQQTQNYLQTTSDARIEITPGSPEYLSTTSSSSSTAYKTIPTSVTTESYAETKNTQYPVQFSKSTTQQRTDNNYQITTNPSNTNHPAAIISSSEKFTNFIHSTLKYSEELRTESNEDTENSYSQTVVSTQGLLDTPSMSAEYSNESDKYPENLSDMSDLDYHLSGGIKKSRLENLKTQQKRKRSKLNNKDQSSTEVASPKRLSKRENDSNMSDLNIKFYKKLPYLILSQAKYQSMDKPLPYKTHFPSGTGVKFRNYKRDINNRLPDNNIKYRLEQDNFETTAEKEAKFNKALEKFVQVINIFGEMDTYFSTRLKNTIRRLARLCDEDGPLI